MHPAIQATAAVVSAALTAVLAGITAVYVRLTRQLATTTRAELEFLQADRRTSATERRVRLLALILDVRMIVTVALPRDREHGAAIMHTPLWSPSAPDLIKHLAVAYGTDAADLAAEAGRFLATLHELAGVARDGYGAAGSLYWD